jgi:peptidyl-tRNA hydrolase, PTH1 family
MNFLIAGLGNIGDEYNGTRHNIGFRILDTLAKVSNISFQDKRYGFIGELSIKGRKLFLLKPSTYMNLSGNAVRYWMNEKKIPIEQLLVVNDDIALPLGTLRMKPGGSEGGHNGLRHITSVLGTNQYARLRFGVGNDFPRGKQVDFVLSHFSEEEEAILAEKTVIATQMITSFCLAGINNTMNQFNNK